LESLEYALQLEGNLQKEETIIVLDRANTMKKQRRAIKFTHSASKADRILSPKMPKSHQDQATTMKKSNSAKTQDHFRFQEKLKIELEMTSQAQVITKIETP